MSHFILPWIRRFFFLLLCLCFFLNVSSVSFKDNSHESYFRERELTRSMRFTCCLIYVNCLYLVLRDFNVNILNSLFCVVKFASSPFRNIISFAFRYNPSQLSYCWLCPPMSICGEPSVG